MPDKSVVVRVKADVAGYQSSIRAAAATTADFARSSLKYSLAHEQAFNRVGRAAVGAGALIVGGLTAAVAAAAKFDQAMSLVKANVDDKSVPSMKRLSEAALEAGRNTVYSATEAAAAEAELVKAGLTSAQVTGGALTAALSLASAGQIDLASAAEVTASTMVQFNLKASDAAHIADDLAAGADKSLGGVQDLGEALKYSGVVAGQFGISLDQTVGVLAEFASNGILGSMAGTGLRQILLSLAAPTTQATATMRQYGISVFDAQGNFIGLNGLAGELKTKLGGLSQQQQQAALSTLFTSRSIAEANILMKDGAAGVDRWTSAVNEQGFAAQQASVKLDNLSGDLKKLRNNIQVALIDTGNEAQGPLRGVVHELTGVVQAFDALSPAAKDVIVITGLVVGGLVGVGGAALLVIPKIAATAKAMRELELASKLSRFALSPWGLALAAGVTALGIFTKSHIDAARRVADLTDAIQQDSGVIGDNTRALVANKLEKDGALATGQKLGINLDTLTNAALGNRQAFDEATRALAEHGDAAGVGAIEAGKYLAALAQTANDTGKATAAQQRIASATDAAATSTRNATDTMSLAAPTADDLASAISGVAQAAQGSVNVLDVLSKTLDGLIGLHTDAARAGIQFQASIDGITAAVKKNGVTLDVNTDKGRAVMGAILDAADAAEKDAEARAKETGSVEEASKAYAAHVDQLKKTLLQSGLSKQAVDDLIKEYANVPPDVFTQIVADTQQANDAIAATKGMLSALPRTVSIAINATASLPARGVQARASGGPVDGPGTKTSDSVLVRASKGEYVMSAAAVDKYGVGMMTAINARRFASGGLIGEAESQIDFLRRLAAIKQNVSDTLANGNTFNAVVTGPGQVKLVPFNPGATALDMSTPQGQANLQTVFDALTAAQAVAQDTADRTGSAAAGNSLYAQEVAQIKAALQQAGYATPDIARVLGYAKFGVDSPTPSIAAAASATVTGASAQGKASASQSGNGPLVQINAGILIGVTQTVAGIGSLVSQVQTLTAKVDQLAAHIDASAAAAGNAFGAELNNVANRAKNLADNTPQKGVFSHG